MKSWPLIPGKTFEKLEQDTDRDHYLTAQEAVEYGLLDGILSSDSLK